MAELLLSFDFDRGSFVFLEYIASEYPVDYVDYDSVYDSVENAYG